MRFWPHLRRVGHRAEDPRRHGTGAGRPWIERSRHRGDLQGLRAVAVILVAVAHARVPLLQGGFIGVDVFFVLSGFLITGLLLSDAVKNGSVSLTNFYARRARRILPAASLTLATTSLVCYYLLNYVRAKQAIWDSLWASIFAANIHFSNLRTDYFARAQPPSPVEHFWSLSVEEQFYLVWPGLLALVLFVLVAKAAASRKARRDLATPAIARLFVIIVALTAVSLVWSIHYTQASPTASYFSTLSRVYELGLGAALATITAFAARIPPLARLVTGWLGLVGIAMSAVLFSAGTPFPGYAALLPTVGAAMVIAAGIGEGRSRLSVGRLLAAAPMRYVGDRSYTYYLWHWPFLIIAAQYFGRTLSVGANLGLLVGAFLLSMFTYRLFENPIRRAEWPALQSLTLWPAAALSVLVVAALVLPSIDKTVLRSANLAIAAEAANLPKNPVSVELATALSPTTANATGPLAAVADTVKSAERGAKIPTVLYPPVGELAGDVYQYPGGCQSEGYSTTGKICRLGDTTSEKLIVAVGDSHLQMWMPAILRLAKEDKWAVIPLGKSGCGSYRWLVVQGEESKGPCTEWYKWVVKEAQSLHPDVLLVSSAYAGLGDSISPLAENGFINVVTALKPFAKQRIVVEDAPKHDKHPEDCLLQRDAKLANCVEELPPHEVTARLAVFDGIDGFHLLRTRDWFCSGNSCPLVIGNTIAYRDQDHVSTTYALQLSGRFRASFDRAVAAR